MFSVENPPTDPACPQLKPCNARASHKRGLPETDLSKLAIVNAASLPKFSIRDYVLSSRGKDIKANWPFSPKTLQLCLKHGVKDLLPPFKPPRKGRTQSLGGCTVENANPDNPSINNFDGEPTQLDHHVGLNSSNLVKPNEKHSEICIDSNSSRYEGGNDLRSTTTSLSPSEIDTIPAFCPSNSPVNFGTLFKAPIVAEAGEPLVSLKSERTAKQLGKKSRFTIKNGAHAYQASCEDFVSNCTSTSETMASKTCPVCRIFSSPSNTTLNAHIDQCLSAESTPKWSLDSKTTKYKFKPKKTKLLMDIYATASPCTLEDLDRRNGTTWALGSRLLTADIEKSETHYEGKRERASLAHPKVTANQGVVYVDSKGTKLRILSAFNDVSLSRVRDSIGSTRSTKEDEGQKLHSPKRKKCHALKYQKFRKLAVQRKTISPLKDFSTQIERSYDGYNGLEEDCKTDKHQQTRRKSHDSGCLRQWIRAKRTGVAKKVSSKERHQILTGELLFETDQSCLDVNTDKFSDMKATNSSENAIFSPEDSKIMETECPLYDDEILQRNGRSSGCMRSDSPLCVEFLRDVEALSPAKENCYKQKKGTTFTGDRFLAKPPNGNGHYMALSSKKRPNILNRYSCDTLSKDCHATALKATKFSSLSEKMYLLSKPSSLKGSNSPVVKKYSAFSKSRMDLGQKVDETTRSFNSETYRISGMPDGSFESWSEGEQTIEGLPKRKVLLYEKGQISVSQRNGTMGLTSLSSGSISRSNYDDENLDSSVQGSLRYFDRKKGVECAGEVIQNHGESTILKSSSKMSSLTESSPNIYELLNSSMTGSGQLKFSINSKQPLYGVEGQDLPTKLKLDDQPESICMKEGAGAMIRRNIDPTAAMHSETSPAISFDPILIPGPPGSFLPSPGEMQSEDFQGNSSLTTSQNHSSQDQHDFTDGASSDSPISTSSSFSTFSAAKSDLNYFPTVHPIGFETKSSSVLSSCNLNPPMENSANFAVATATETKNISCDRESLQLRQISLEEKNLSFTNGEKLCCCQKREKVPPWVNLSYQQPQLLKYHSFPSKAIPCCKQKMGYNLNRGPNKFDPRPEILPLCSCNMLENVTAPSRYSTEGIFPFVSSPKAGVKFPNCGNFESTTSSSSNPVLRLMGKNLMVVNNNEDATPRLEQPKPRSPTKNFFEFTSYLKNSSGQYANKDFNLFHQDLTVLDTDSCKYGGRHFDVRLLGGPRTNTDLKTLQSLTQRPAVICPPNQTGNGDYITSMQPHKLRYNHCLAPHDSDKNKAKEKPMCNVGELMSTPHSQQMNANSSGAPVDGYPNCVPKMTPCVSKYLRGFEASLKLTPGI